MDPKQRRASFQSRPSSLTARGVRRWTEASLDEDIVKLFESPERESISTVFRRPTEPPTERSHHYDESDYRMHRGESFPHMHQPLKALRTTGKRHRTSSRPSQTDLTEQYKSSSSIVQPGHEERSPPPADGLPQTTRKVGFYLGERGQDSMDSVSEVENEASGRPPPLNAATEGKPYNEGKPWSPTKPSPLVMVSLPPDTSSPKTSSYSSPSLDSESSPAHQRQQGAFKFAPDDSLDTASPPSVRFILGREESKEDEGEGDVEKEEEKEEPKHRHRHKHHHRHHHKGHRGQEDLIRRQRSGTEMDTPEKVRKVPTEMEEAMLLQEGDLNHMASHRYEDPSGMRRHKIQAKSAVSSFIHVGRKDGGTGLQAFRTHMSAKKLYDHQPHEVFVELDELQKGELSDDLEWKETARWIKYEEDLEEGANRWGKPHVASLSFHSLLNLRKCLEHGTVILDLEERELPGIAYRVVEAMVINDQIKPEDKGAVMRALLLRHKHVNEHKHLELFSGLRRNFSSNISTSSLTSLGEEKPKIQKSVSFAATTPEDVLQSAKTPLMSSVKEDGKVTEDSHASTNAGNGTVAIEVQAATPTSNGVTPSGTISEDMHKIPIMKKIPDGAEATTVLVGGVDFLEQPTIAFVRLAEGIILPSLLEVPIPVRFMFILLGPIGDSMDYHEIGRSISTLMSNRKFHNIAYRAEDRHDLMRAINEFLDDSIVLPPGDWESKSLLPLTQSIQRKSMELRKRRGQKTSDGERLVLPLDIRTVPTDEKRFDDPLKRTRRPFGGLVNELKRRYPLYVSDIKDALNPQCLASVVFIYFAALSGAISFGGLLGDKTNNLIGVPETLVATSVSGILFSFFSAQPLMIIGVTGPVLLFDESLFSFCKSFELDFLSLRVWIGIWVAVITLLFIAAEGSSLLRYITLFTEEILAALISLIFIYESIMKLVEIFRLHPLQAMHCSVPVVGFPADDNQSYTPNITELDNLSFTHPFNSTTTTAILQFFGNETEVSHGTTFEPDTASTAGMLSPMGYVVDVHGAPVLNQPNTALLSTILMLGTFFIAWFLREFRNGKYLGRTARRALGDFGVPIAIVIMVLLDYSIKDTFTQKLQVPSGLTPSLPKVRGWIISPLGTERPLPVWLIFAAILPALLFFILLFMEVQICELIINKKERRLQKGTGFHVDILLMSFLNVFCGLIGGPWMSAAIVRAISHIMSLTVMSRTHAPGEKPHILEVKEQRLTNLFVSLIVGMSVGMSPLLRLIPVAVLFGIFLYMGFVSMIGVQFFERLQLMLMPVKHHPDNMFVRRVRTWKMHMYTLIQLGCLVLLWVVKSTEAAISLPFVLLLMIPFRRQLVLFFTVEELRALDGGQPDNEDEEDEPDFYEEALLPG